MSSAPSREGRLCWIEIPARDVQKLKTFYSNLFPSWTWDVANHDPNEERLVLFNFDSREGMPGCIMKIPSNASPQSQVLGSGFTTYFMVDSLEKTEAKVHELGGKTVVGKTAQSTSGFYMNLADTEGNRFGLYEIVTNHSE